MMSEEHENQLVQHLQEAERQNLKLRETIMELKRELKMLRSQGDFRRERDHLVQEKSTWVAKHETLQIEHTRLIEENTQLSFIKDEHERVKSERNALKHQCTVLEQRVNESVLERERLVVENRNSTSRLSELQMSLTESESVHQKLQNQITKLRSTKQIHSQHAPMTSGINVKTVYNRDVRNWQPQTATPYKELLEFLDKQYDSTYVITYKDLDNDSIRVTCDDDLFRAFSLAQDYGWNAIKLQCDIKAEQKLRRELGMLELKFIKVKKQLKKIKANQNGMKKGQALLDAIYLNRKKDDALF